MEFVAPYDKFNNIPISLKLWNLPATIASLANIHGVTLMANQQSHIHQVEDELPPDDLHDDPNKVDDCRIKSLSNRMTKPRPLSQPSSLQQNHRARRYESCMLAM